MRIRYRQFSGRPGQPPANPVAARVLALPLAAAGAGSATVGMFPHPDGGCSGHVTPGSVFLTCSDGLAPPTSRRGDTDGDARWRADWGDTSTPAVVLKLDPNVMHHGGLGRHPQPGPPRRAGLRRARGAAGPGRQLALPARPVLLASRSAMTPTGSRAGLLDAGRPDRPARRAAAHRRRGRDLPGRARRRRCGRGSSSPTSPPSCRARWPGKFSLLPAVPRAGHPGPGRGRAGDPRRGARVRRRAGYPLIAKLTTPWRAAPCAAPRS